MLRNLLNSVTLEPVMLVDGACKEAMLLFIENVQLNKICSVKLGYSEEVCSNLTGHPDHSISVQKEFSLFAFYNSIILSVLPLVFVLFMGAWSDKYGRKIPLLITLISHAFYAGGYMLVNWQTSWPVEVLYLVTFLEALGGSNVGLLSTAISYICDITRESQRTVRVSTANSVWFLGGPVGTLVGALIIKYSGYDLALGLVFLSYISAIVYVLFVINESHGPKAKKTLAAQGSLALDANVSEKNVSRKTMIIDFFNWHRVLESFKTALKKREGNTRIILMVVMLANMIRRMAKGFFIYMFTRRVLSWDATDYGYWITYRNLLAALGSLFLVPLLTKSLAFLDTTLVLVGALSLTGEYICYGLASGPALGFFLWLGPPIGIVSNACVIALKSMCTKLVTSSERGRINAVLAALNGLMPMAGYAVYSPIYYHTVNIFPSAQFFVAASLNIIIVVTFVALRLMRVSSYYDAEDLQDGEKETHAMMEAFRYHSSIKLKSIARTMSGPGGMRIKHPIRVGSKKNQLEDISEYGGELTTVAELSGGSKSNWSVLIATVEAEEEEEAEDIPPQQSNIGTKEQLISNTDRKLESSIKEQPKNEAKQLPESHTEELQGNSNEDQTATSSEGHSSNKEGPFCYSSWVCDEEMLADEVPRELVREELQVDEAADNAACYRRAKSSLSDSHC